MMRIGLTGGIGTGKSTISLMLKEAGFKIIDADIIARDVLVKYPEILERVRIEFGEGFFDWRGEFRRKEFGNHIFRFPKQRIKYENIILPFIKNEINNQIKTFENNGEKLVIVDAPTLIETKLHEEMDFVILVYADSSTQIQRLKNRDKLTNNDALNRINAQMSVERKKEFANVIIDNSKDLIYTKEQVDDFIDFVSKVI
ncbi:dephospho-CoA kinase [Clostridium baratii]|uniref:Dephospho-CoA kinase n=3 Tax=Clostridium TaxID=1485 RepID=A0A0A7FYX4_9CLOT|nr:dephospho-CoA kinase [Clostridium baratii]AIY84066.1 dephospho-CoA kinase [Clostridium baratii str. Sullivan]AQM58758.1 dephospho-CoA kinase [Clostridium baratii]KJU72717.1 dephospho-CoA kinase [Clostridium baratii]MBS6005751.1 dephospho-CoA kinase [Clostridium baratii]MBS6043109.1 dephospho-CoA kinase [Clostridium baratii]